MPKQTQRTWILALTEAVETLLAVSDYGSADASVPMPTAPRFNLVAQPTEVHGDITRFAFCPTLPPDIAPPGPFLPASGVLYLDWSNARPQVTAELRGAFDATLRPHHGLTKVWHCEGSWFPWSGEIRPRDGRWP